MFKQLFRLALERKPAVIVCVDFQLFNRLFAHAIKEYVRARRGWFHDWDPKIVQYVSPQVWASREGRADQLARDCDLLLSIIPFEKEWYARRTPKLRVEYVGNPIMDRHAMAVTRSTPSLIAQESPAGGFEGAVERVPSVLLLPGSRVGELARHLPVMLGAMTALRAEIPGLRARMVVPNDSLVQQAKNAGLPGEVQIQVGGLSDALAQADVAIAKTGTVTMECAFYGVPTVALYKTSWANYQIGKRIIKVKYLAMPNLLANEEIFPEFIQNAATAENIARATLELLRDDARRARIKARLAEIVASLGGPGASRRAAKAILDL
jgi:lipid-A-disaccharide synthase